MLKLYNTLTKQKEEFKPINVGKVGMYVCGPTVYDHCHLGHGRGYVSMDILRKYLEYSGYEVRFIMNYTDVGHLVDDAETGEDKIARKAKKEKLDPMEIVSLYIQSCKEDFRALNIKNANFYPRPTEYIAQIIKFIEGLIEKGYAYENSGSVYFSVDKFPAYGKLSGRKKEDLLSGARIEINPEKKNPLDFALWIKAPGGHLLKWESPWGFGYPGWHIECSVMSCDLLGQDTFDIHGGGNENIFPHNENEVAQSEAYLEKKMANFWVLWNMVNVDGIKMSKSKGNFTTIKDALEKYPAAVIRLWILSSHYRSVMDYTDNSMNQVKENLKRISDWVKSIKNVPETPVVVGPLQIKQYQKRFEGAMDDDLNTPLALSVLYELITETNRRISEKSLSKDDAEKILSFWEKINKVLGLILLEEDSVPGEISKLAEERKAARENKDFQKSDELRDKLEKSGYVVEDKENNNYILKKK